MNNFTGHAGRTMMIRSIFMLLITASTTIFSADSSFAILPTVATAVLSPESLSLGDQVGLHLRLPLPKGASASLIQEHPDLGSFSVVSDKKNRLSGTDFDTLTWDLGVCTYDQTRDTIPPIGFVVSSGDSLFDTVYSNAIIARIVSVIPSSLPPDSQKLREIRPPFSAGKYPWHLWLLIPLAIGVGYLIWRFFKNRKKAGSSSDSPASVIPPFEEAMAAIAALDASDLLITGRTREYVFALSDILKHYLGLRFENSAAEWTTYELVDWVRASPMPSAASGAAEAFLRESHMVKFAKVIPDSTAAKAMREKTVFVIEQTRPLPTSSVAAIHGTAQGASA